MGLSDFWDNITTPGFIQHSFNELCQLGKEIKKDTRELVEEGQELFGDAFVEMVVKGNDYTTSAEMKRIGQERIEAIHQTILTERGVSEDAYRFLELVRFEFKTLIGILENYPTEKVHKISMELQSRFGNLIFVAENHAYLNVVFMAGKLLQLPRQPKYQQPSHKDDQTIVMGPISIDVSDKKKRRIAAEEYLQAIEEYAESCKNSRCEYLINPHFITADLVDSLQELAYLLWAINRMEDEDSNKLRGLILLRAAIYTPMALSLSDVDDRKINGSGLQKDLREIERFIESIITD